MNQDSIAEDLEALLKASQLATAAAHKLLESKKAEVRKMKTLDGKKEAEKKTKLIHTLGCVEDERNELMDALRRQYAANPDMNLLECEEKLAEYDKLFEELKNVGPP